MTSKLFPFLEVTLSNTHVQCVAGALRASLEIWSPQFELFHIYFPCLRQVMDNGGIGYFSLTVGKTFQNSYVFMEQTSEKRPTRRKKASNYNQVNKKLNVSCKCFY